MIGRGSWRILLAVACLSAGLSPRFEPRGASAREDRTVPGPAYTLSDTILVRSTKLPLPLKDLAASATVITTERIRTRISTEVRPLVSTVPGLHSFDLSGSEGEGVVESRGFTSFGQTSYLQVLIDGIPVSDLERDGVDWNLVGAAQLERIEVLRGPVSFLYGNSSMAGVVNLVTRRPTPGFGAWAETCRGSYGLFSATGGTSWGGSRTRGSFSVHRRSLDGFRHHGGSSITGGYGFLDTGLGRSWTLRTSLLLQHHRQEIPGPLPDSLVASDPRETWSWFARDRRRQEVVQPSIEIRGNASRALELVGTLQAYYRRVDATETVVPVGTLDREARSRSFLGEVRLHWMPGSPLLSRALVGATLGGGVLRSRYFDRQGQSPGAGVGAGDVTRTSGGLYGWVESRPARGWTVTGGLRWDWTRSSMEDPLDPAAPDLDQDDAAVSPVLTVNYELPGWGNAYLSAAGSFKAPTLEQLYDRRPYDLDGPGDLPGFTLSSPALESQRGLHLDLGTRARPCGTLALEAGVYYAKSTDEIGFDLANFRYDNIEESTHSGFEGLLDLAPLDLLDLQVGYTFTRARFDEGPDDGRQINSVPKHQVHGTLRLGPGPRTTWIATVRHVRDQWLDEGNRHEIPFYTLLDLGTTQGVGPIEIFGSVRNLLGESYRPAGYLTVDENGEVPLYFPGAGRSFEAGIRVATTR